MRVPSASSRRSDPSLPEPSSFRGSRPASVAVGVAEDDTAFLLVKHACIVAALASRLPADVDISPEGLRRSMDVYLKAARKRVSELTSMAPEHAMSALTQIFVFEGLRKREHQESVTAKERSRISDDLTAQIRKLEQELKDKNAEVQMLREAVLEVQTNANKQVIDARTLQMGCEREIARQSAELMKLTNYSEHLKRQLDDAESRGARQHFNRDGPSALGGSAVVARLLRRSNRGFDREEDSRRDGGAEDDSESEPSPSASKKTFRDTLRPPALIVETESPALTTPITDNLEPRSFTPNAKPAFSNLKSPNVPVSGKQTRVGFEPAVAPKSNPSSASSPYSFTLDGGDSAHGSGSGFRAAVPNVPNEAYTEAMYIHLGGSKDRTVSLPNSAVLRHLEKTYDDLGDPHRFSRLLGSKRSFTFQEFGLVLLQVARI
jgi:hypothetical protein